MAMCISYLRPFDPVSASWLSTIVLEAGNAASRAWRPTSGAVPLFAYSVTYIMADGTPHKVQGVGEGSSMLVDWPVP